MIAVMTIIVLVIGLTLPAVNSVMEASQLSQAAQTISGELELAHQISLSLNHNVEVRFYQYAVAGNAGESAGSPSTGKFRALQIFDTGNAAGVVALDKVQTMPPTMIIDSGSKLSSIIGTATSSTSTAPTLTSGSTLNVPIPAAGLAYNSVAFQLRADGSTNLLNGLNSQWFVTLHAGHYGDALATAPLNFFTFQVNASNGHARFFRP